MLKNTSKPITGGFLFDAFYNFSAKGSEVRKLTNEYDKNFYYSIYTLDSKEKDILLEAAQSNLFDAKKLDDLNFIVQIASRLSFRLRNDLSRLVHSINEITSSFYERRAYSCCLLIVKNLPKIDFPYRIEALLGVLSGEIMHYPEEGSCIMDLKENPQDPCIDPSYQNLIDFSAHTDLSYFAKPPNIMGVHYISDDPKENGSPFFCDIQTIVADLSREAKQELTKSNFRFVSPSHYSGLVVDSVPILSYQSTKGWSIRFRQDKISVLNKTQDTEKALGELISSIKQNIFKIKIPKESFVFINNQTLLHGREGYRSNSVNSLTRSKRHLTRMYINSN